MKELMLANLYADFLQAAEDFKAQAEDSQTYARMLTDYARARLDDMPPNSQKPLLPVVESLVVMFAQHKQTQDTRLAQKESAQLWQALLAKVVGTAVRVAKAGGDVAPLKEHISALYQQAGLASAPAFRQIAQAEAYGRCAASPAPLAASLAEDKTLQPYLWQQLCADKKGQKNSKSVGMVGGASSSLKTEGEPHA